MKSYNEIDLDESPIVVLGCGPFFTAETLHGMIGMSEVYNIDGYGEFTSLKDSSELSTTPFDNTPPNATTGSLTELSSKRCLSVSL